MYYSLNEFHIISSGNLHEHEISPLQNIYITEMDRDIGKYILVHTQIYVFIRMIIHLYIITYTYLHRHMCFFYSICIHRWWWWFLYYNNICDVIVNGVNLFIK